MTSMLQIEPLSIERQGHLILQTPTLAVNHGEFVAILGPNGAGKSSLLKAITGEWHTQRGECHFYGQRISQWSRKHLATQLGVLPQSSQIDFPFTVAEVTAIGAIPLKLKQRQVAQSVRHFLQQTDTLHLIDKTYSLLSGGEKQRVQLARVLLQLSQAEQSPLLLLDEPTSAQDIAHQHHLMQRIKSLCEQQEYGVVAVLHDLNLACRYVDSVWVISDKRVQVQGNPLNVLSPEVVQQHWHYLPEVVQGSVQKFALL